MDYNERNCTDEPMKNRNLSKTRVLLLIPIAVFAVTVICLVFALMLASPTNKGTIYSLFALVGILGIVLSPLPCLAMSVAGTIFAAKAVKEGIVPARKYLVLGIVEILTHASGVILAILMVFVAGQGV